MVSEITIEAVPISKANLQVLDYLSSKGVRFSIQDWYTEYWVGREKIEAFLYDPDALFAKLNDVTKSEYRDWREAGGRVHCSATTRSGKHGSLKVKDSPLWLSTREWLARRGEYCSRYSEGAPSVRVLTVRVT